MLPSYDWDLKRLIQETADSAQGELAKECVEALEEPQIIELIDVIVQLLDKAPSRRINSQQAIRILGPEWAERARREARVQKSVEQEQRALEDRTRREQEKIVEEEKRLRAAQEKEEARKRKVAEDAAIKASKAEEQRLREILASGSETERNNALGTVRGQRGGFLGGLFGRKTPPAAPRQMPDSSSLGDDDIANIVPESWREGREFFCDRQFAFQVDEIVVAFRSDGSRRYGRIIQDNGQGSYDILVDRFGGEGAGQYRTDFADRIGKIATTASLQDELAANYAALDRDARFKRAQEMVAARVGDDVPESWRSAFDYNFSPTSTFKNSEMVVVARSDGALCWGKVQSFTGDGLYEVLVESGAKRLYFPASLGKILA